MAHGGILIEDMIEFSPLASDVVHDKGEWYTANFDSVEFDNFRRVNKLVKFWPAVKEYNMQSLDWKHVAEVPTYSKVLVIGAGPSFTDEIADSIDVDDYDAIILTIPMLDKYDHILDWKNVYVADGELEKFVGELFFPIGRRERIKLICPFDKYFEAYFTFKELYFYDRPIHGVDDYSQEWPRSGGAIALHVAVVAMDADIVDYVGIDLTGHYRKFILETMPYLDLDYVNRLGVADG